MGRLPTEATARRLALHAAEIWSRPPAPADVVYLPQHLVLANFPLRRPQQMTSWRNWNGNIGLSIRPAFDGQGVPMFPYGMVARLLLIQITTRAVRRGEREILWGPTLTDVIKDLGLTPGNGGSGAKRSTASSVWYQMNALFRAEVVLESVNCPGGREGRCWSSFDLPAPNTLAGISGDNCVGRLALSDHYISACSRAVPLDGRIIQALRQKPSAIDVYAWLTYRVWTLLQKRLPEVHVSWERLHEQFGSEHASVGDFRRSFLATLGLVNCLYRGFEVELPKGRLLLRPLWPSVPSKSVQKHTFA